MATAPTAANPITLESFPALFSDCWETVALEDGATEVATLVIEASLDEASTTEEEETGATVEEETGVAAEEETGAAEEETGAAAEDEAAAAEEAATLSPPTLAASNSGCSLEEYHGNLDRKGPNAATSTSLYKEV